MAHILLQGPQLSLLFYSLAFIVHICPFSPQFPVDLVGPTVRLIPITVTTCVVLLFAALAIKVYDMKDLHHGHNKEAALREASRLRAYAVTMREDASQMEAEADRLEGIHFGKSPRMFKTEKEIERGTRELIMKADRPDASAIDGYSVTQQIHLSDQPPLTSCKDFSDDALIPVYATRQYNRSLAKQSYEPATPGVFQRKIYCSHWLRTGECDFTQQGCEFLHVMPDPETLKRLQYRTYPRWYCEKMNIPVDAAALVGDSVPKAYSGSLSRVPTQLYKKIYCPHWLRTGECDFLQQGCIYQHLMPKLETLNKLGFRTYPRWWRDKISMEDGASAPIGGRRLRQLSSTTDHSQDQGLLPIRPLLDLDEGNIIFDDANLEDAKQQVL